MIPIYLIEREGKEREKTSVVKNAQTVPKHAKTENSDCESIAAIICVPPKYSCDCLISKLYRRVFMLNKVYQESKNIRTVSSNDVPENGIKSNGC